MEIEEKKNKNTGQYKPILDGIPDWPVYQLSKSRKEFVEEVAQKAIQRIHELRPNRKQLIDELEATVLPRTESHEAQSLACRSERRRKVLGLY
ncbi:MAG: hypothetical protein WDO15_18560 [Bacteroidota bacterium]